MPYDSFKHRRRSIRLRGYDYSQAGAYFVTICEVNRECIFGEIVDGEMCPNQFGEIVLKWWNELPNYYPPVALDEFVVMPNHLHGIIVITGVGAGSSRPITGRHDAAPTEKRTLGQLIGYIKFQITKEINQVRDAGYAKVLQRDYFEHIIRNEREWNAIAEYIYNNPANWRADLDNPSNFPKRPPPKTSDEYWRDAGL
ncbi:MAG: transposase [Chloroflexi bacterium]|nr:transposase [Chloroflexota bacterium]